LKLMQDFGYSPLLNAVEKADICNVLNSCFTGKRAEYLTWFVCANAERLGLIR